MCGIIGYIGKSEAVPILMDGLRRLEYRGYDSAGIAILNSGKIIIQRAEGKLANLARITNEKEVKGKIGIGHTRWATHGRPSTRNAHPHRAGNIVVVHNGIIENYLKLKQFLTEEGCLFATDTDSEVICHLIDFYMKRNKLTTLQAIRECMKMLHGSYALVILNATEHDKIYAAKHGSPLVVGVENGNILVASDITALLPYTKDMIFFEDGDYAVLENGQTIFFDENGKKATRLPQHIPWTPLMAERGGYKHFMLKEIFEQIQIMKEGIVGRVDQSKNKIELCEVNGLYDGNKPKFDRIVIVACGTSWHAGLVARYQLELLAKIPVQVDLASEFRYRKPILNKQTLVITISQSGETADTLAAQSMALKQGVPVLAVCNVVGSSLSRSASAVLYTRAGPEIGVASTKAFTSQILVLYLFALDLASKTQAICRKFVAEKINELIRLPVLVQEMLKQSKKIGEIALRISGASHALFIGRGMSFPIALEGALKLKEISYIHAEGFAAGELKHGPIALVHHDVPVIAIIPKDATYEKTLSNIEEVKARDATVIALASASDERIKSKARDIIFLPDVSPFVMPILSVIPLQLLSYYTADHKGTDVDQPRNLAKSVTVE